MAWIIAQARLIDGGTARVVELDRLDEVDDVLASESQAAVAVLLVGGADQMATEEIDRLWPFFADALVPALVGLGGVVVDGGTDAGVMRLIGEAVTTGGRELRLVGVAPRRKVRVGGAEKGQRADLARGHADFFLVPGSEWGDEGPWLQMIARRLAGGRIVTIVANGGDIAWREAIDSLVRGERVIAVAGSGRTADRLSSLAIDPNRHDGESALPPTGHLEAIPLDIDEAGLTRRLRASLRD